MPRAPRPLADPFRVQAEPQRARAAPCFAAAAAAEFKVATVGIGDEDMLALASLTGELSRERRQRPPVVASVPRAACPMPRASRWCCRRRREECGAGARARDNEGLCTGEIVVDVRGERVTQQVRDIKLLMVFDDDLEAAARSLAEGEARGRGPSSPCCCCLLHWQPVNPACAL